MYYVEEGRGHTTHPLADIFFLTRRNEVVLVSITGGTEKRSVERRNKLADWIVKEQESVENFELHGVVFALGTALDVAMSRMCVVKMLSGFWVVSPRYFSGSSGTQNS